MMPFWIRFSYWKKWSFSTTLIENIARLRIQNQWVWNTFILTKNQQQHKEILNKWVVFELHMNSSMSKHSKKDKTSLERIQQLLSLAASMALMLL